MRTNEKTHDMHSACHCLDFGQKPDAQMNMQCKLYTELAASPLGGPLNIYMPECAGVKGRRMNDKSWRTT